MGKSFYKKAISKIIREPNSVFIALIAIFRGCFYIIYYRVSKKNVKIQFPFKAHAKVNIVGPGSVFINKNSSAYFNAFKGLTIVTLSKDAEVIIGKNCSLGGLIIRCRNKIKIKDRTMTADSLIQDTNFINLEMTKTLLGGSELMESKPIVIGKNVWLGARSCILGGSNIGDDSVIARGSTCFGTSVKEYCLALGNPIKRYLPIDKLLKLKGQV